jgi:hypothetical protein
VRGAVFSFPRPSADFVKFKGDYRPST